MWDKIGEFFTAVPWWELLLIFFAKTVEVTIGTLRVILINKGYRKQGTALSFVEIMIWVFVASTVITGLVDKPIKGLMYGIGFSAGVYLGSLIESWIAFGKVMIQVIISKDSSVELISLLREAGYGVTTLDAKGKDNDKAVLLIIANRKGKEVIFDLINNFDQSAVIIANDVANLQGGFLKNFRRIAK